ncbi:MAG: hypothetical protein ACYTF1_06575 [Planctomycetota bacterium]|jgi:hypothetical protein
MASDLAKLEEETMNLLLVLAVLLSAPPVKMQPTSAPAGANDLALKPAEGLKFVQESGVRIAHPGFDTPNEPDCQVFREKGKVVYRLWWTTRRYDAQVELNETRWSSHVSISTDGLKFRYERGPEFRSGRFTNRTDRDLIRLSNGRWRAYTLIGGGAPWYCIDSYLGSRAAAEWKWEPGKRIDSGKPGDMDHTAARAPEAVCLPDGRTRVYYIGWNGPSGPYSKQREPGHRWRILSAVLKDGLRFSREPGIRMDVIGDAEPPHGPIVMAKPQVVRLSDGRWRMYFAALPGSEEGPYEAGFLFSAVSKHGLNWHREPGIRLKDADGKPIHAKYPSIVRKLDGRLRMYYDGHGGIRSAVAAR